MTDEPKTEAPTANAEPSNRVITGIGWRCPKCSESLRSEQQEMVRAVASGQRVGPGNCPKCGAVHYVGRSLIVAPGVLPLRRC
jgi:hypothetical protein